MEFHTHDVFIAYIRSAVEMEENGRVVIVEGGIEFGDVQQALPTETIAEIARV